MIRKAMVLCGFMGCGKTTVGRLTAQKKGIPFLDVDRYIEKQAGKSIADIFAQEGESFFRDLEHQALRELSERKGILSSGGGALTFSRNVELLREKAEIVYLQCDFDLCYERIRNSSRPLVQQQTREQLEELYWKRDQLYLACCHRKISNNASLRSAVEQLSALWKGSI